MSRARGVAAFVLGAALLRAWWTSLDALVPGGDYGVGSINLPTPITLAFSGMFDRFPKLRVFFAETDFGWLPYVKEQIDNNYRRLEPTQKFGLKRLPSEYVSDHCHFGYMTDTFGIDQRKYVGAERILWSSDYPHISADWPYSWRTIQASFSGISKDESELILHGNAERLFNF